MTHFAPALHAVAPRLLLAVLTAFTALLVSQSSAFGNGGALRPVIAAGGAHACALADTGSVRCWGENDSGQLGNGGTTASPTPARALRVSAANNSGEAPKPATLEKASTVVASASSTCVISVDSSIWCWGSNSYGELGIGAADAVPHPTPVQIPGSKDFYLLAAGGNHFCAATWNGDVSCWGSNAQGQLGNGTVGGVSASPVTVGGVKKLKALTAGANFTCANLETTKVRCWGANDKGQLVPARPARQAPARLMFRISRTRIPSSPAPATSARSVGPRPRSAAGATTLSASLHRARWAKPRRAA